MRDTELEKALKDISVTTGSETGFQFELTCRVCKKVWQSDFTPCAKDPNKIISKFFKKTPDEMVDTVWEKGKQEALIKAAEEASQIFVYCSKCSHYVCGNCFHPHRNQCLTCVADTARAAMDEAAREQAEQLRREAETKCPRCFTLVGRAKFCPKCGEKISRGYCVKCNAKLLPGAAFCSECGTKV